MVFIYSFIHSFIHLFIVYCIYYAYLYFYLFVYLFRIYLFWISNDTDDIFQIVLGQPYVVYGRGKGRLTLNSHDKITEMRSTWGLSSFKETITLAQSHNKLMEVFNKSWLL